MNSSDQTSSAGDEGARLAALPPDLPDLVFISGQHRSGTTFLHQWLADTGRFNFITPFDIVNFDRLLSLQRESGSVAWDELDRELKTGQTNRGLDECGVGAGVAEEYGFLLLPKQGDFSFFTPSLRPEMRPRFESVCRKKLALDPARRPLLLKNPDDHYFNFAAIGGFYPGARWVFTNRHPLAILNSQIKAWVGLLEAALQLLRAHQPVLSRRGGGRDEAHLVRGAGCAPRRQAEHMLHQMLGAIDYYRAQLPAFPADACICPRYDDFCADEATNLPGLGVFLCIPVSGDLAGVVQPRPMRILPYLQEVFDEQHARTAPLLEFLGYNAQPAGA